MTYARPMFPPEAELNASPLPAQIDRRGVLCAMAALPLAAVPPAPVLLTDALTSPDPILAAIEAHVFAAAKFENLFEGFDAPEDDDSGAETDRAAWAMLQVEPTSIDGVRALLAYFARTSETDEQFFPEVYDGEVNFPSALARHAAQALSKLEGVR